MRYTPAQVRKAAVAVVGAAAEAASVGLIPAPYDKYGTVVVALATALGVYQVPNGVAPISPRSVVGLPYEPVEEPPADETDQ